MSESWLPAAHAAQKQLERLGGKRGAISIECPPTLPEDDLPGSVTTRLDGEYTLSSIADGFPLYSCLDRGQPSGGLQLYYYNPGRLPADGAAAAEGAEAKWVINDKFTPESDACIVSIAAPVHTAPTLLGPLLCSVPSYAVCCSCCPSIFLHPCLSPCCCRHRRRRRCRTVQCRPAVLLATTTGHGRRPHKTSAPL